MERYLVELDGDQLELLSGMVREAIKVADQKKLTALEAILSALGNMRWKAGDRRADCGPLLSQSSSASRFTAGASGFLNLSQSGVRPDR